MLHQMVETKDCLGGFEPNQMGIPMNFSKSRPAKLVSSDMHACSHMTAGWDASINQALLTDNDRQLFIGILTFNL